MKLTLKKKRKKESKVVVKEMSCECWVCNGKGRWSNHPKIIVEIKIHKYNLPKSKYLCDQCWDLYHSHMLSDKMRISGKYKKK